MTINKHLRVLAINGGGIRGYMPAMLLKHISDMSDKEIPELFDVIIGTSVGGILASAYTMPAEFGNYDRGNVKYNALQVLNLLLDNKDMIFSTRDGSIFDGPLFNRDTLDQFLAEKLNINGTYAKMSDTLIPIALTSLNVVDLNPQLWSSCSKRFSQYFIKDAAGSTSAAPVFFAPKLTSVINLTSDQLSNCVRYGYYGKDNTCYYKAVDGGLFANAPALLTSYLLGRYLHNEVTTNCPNYNTFGGLNLTTNVTWATQFIAGQNYPMSYMTVSSQDINLDITIVEVGTGVFLQEDSSLVDKLVSYTKWAINAGWGMVAFGIYNILSAGYLFYKSDALKIKACCNILKLLPIAGMHAVELTEKTLLTPNVNEDIAVPNIPGTSSLCNPWFWVHGIGVVVTLGIGCVSIYAGVRATEYSNELKSALITDNGNPLDALLNNNLLGSMMTGSERGNLAVTRDVFSTLIVNPILNSTPISLSDVSNENILLMQIATSNYISNNRAAFNSLTSCLLNTEQRTQSCIDAMVQFDNVSTQAGGKIESFVHDWEV